MIIVFKNNNDNNFTKSQIAICNKKYMECTDLNDLLLKKDNITDEYIYILKKNYGFIESFYFNLDEIDSIKENIVLGYNNINVEKNKDFICEYKNHQDNDNLNKRFLTFVKIKTELISKLNNQDLKNLDDFLFEIDFKYITNENLASEILISHNIVDNNDNILLKNFRNLKRLENINNVYQSYLNLISENTIDENINEVRLLYNELNKERLSCFIVFGDHQKILNNLKETKYNSNKNKVYLLNEDDLDTSGLNFEIEKMSLDLKSLNHIIEKTPYHYDCYFIDDKKYIDKVLYKKQSQILDGKDNYKLLKISIIYLKFFIIESENFNDHILNLGKLVYSYLKNDIYIVEEAHNLIPNIEIKLKNYNKNIIDELYDGLLYDECILLINFVIKNRLFTDSSYMYKIFSILDKINYRIHPKELVFLLNLIKFNNVDELFSISIILKYHKLEDLIIEKIKIFISNYNDNKEGEIIKIIYLLHLFNFFEKEIDIFQDTSILNFLVNNLQLISEKYNSLKELDSISKPDNIYASILLFLNSRLELIETNGVKDSIKEKVNGFLGVDLENLKNVDEEKIVDIFKKYPMLIWKTKQSLSDFMVNTKDIILKRENLTVLSDIIISNWDVFNQKIKDENLVFNFSNFKYSYHGIPNKHLFENVVKIKEYGLKNQLDSENLLNFTPQETSKKKIGFLSDFLTRNHSVFKDRHQVIKYLSVKEEFEVYLITFKSVEFGKEEIYKNTKKIVLCNNSMYNNVKLIRTLELDKLVFCEIGMDNRASTMAHFRMANKQYNTWGHSDTSGYSTIDYFVSSKLYELPYEESQKHYSEKLILQNGMCTCYVNPTAKYNLLNTRSFYGLSEYEKIVLCPQSLFKIHPDFDLYIFEILLKNPNCSIVLLENERKTKMYERWDKVLKNYPKYFGVLSRVKFVPPQSHQNFVNLMKCSDVLIDPYPFGGCNSSMESFSLFKPLVTQPSIRINGRFTYGFYKKMGMDDMIANNMEEYVDITTRLLKDKEFYDKQEKLLRDNSDILFEDQETLKEWEELMSQ